MSHFIGATGLDIFDDAIATAIEETTITLTNLIDAVAIQDNLNAIYSSNYSDTVGIFGSNYTELNSVYSSNYADKVGIWGSNYTDREILYTSNYVRTTSNILVNRIKLLEGSEGSAGDPSADPPVPPVPPSGTYAILAAIGVLTAASVANGVTAITLINNLTGVVNDNAKFGSNYAYDKVGMYSSNYSDKVGMYSSNYAYDKVGMYSSNYARDKIGVYSSNYSDKVGVYSSNYAYDKVGMYSSNYAYDKVGVYSSNYAYDKVGMYSSKYAYDKVGMYSSNYAYDKVGMWSSNYAYDKVGMYSSNYAYDKVGVYSSNYAYDKVGMYSSNYAYDKVGMYSSNYAYDKVGMYSSNYAYDKVGMYSSNYAYDKVGMYSSNYAYDKVGVYSSNYAYDKVGVYSSNYAYDKVGMYSSNYAYDKVGMYSSNYTERLIAAIPSSTNYWTTSGTNDIYLNQSGSVGIGTNTPQNKLHIYNATSSALRLETATSGTASVIFQRGTTTDIRTDYRIINDGDILKFQYQDNLVNFGATGSDIMWVYDKRTEFVKDGYFSGTVGIGMLPDVNALSITGDTYMDGSLGINVLAGSYPLDVLGNARIDGEVGIGAAPLAGVKMYVSGTSRLNGNVGIGVAPTTYALDINGDMRMMGYLGIGTIPSSSTYRLDILGNFRTQGGIVSTGIIQAGNGLTASSGLITASAGISSTTLTTSGLITATNATTGTSDSLNIRYDTRNGIRVQQRYIGTDDVGYDIIQKVANVDKTASLTLYNGNVGIGTTNPANILQVGLGRLRISNGSTDYTIIGTNDAGNPATDFHTRILLYGINNGSFAAGPGSILYLAGNTGKHLFHTQTITTSTERMRIADNGNVAIGTTDTTTYKLNVAGDINVSGAFRINGTALSTGSSQWITSGTNIYYNSGNVGIGTTNPQSSYKLQVQGNAYVANTLVFNDNYRDGGASFACNKIALYGGVNTPTTTSTYGFGVAGGTLEYFSASVHKWYNNTTGGTGYGTERMNSDLNGTLYINNVNATDANPKLFVVGSDVNNCSALFYHPNRSQGIGITFDGLVALAPGGNQHIVMKPTGTGMFIVNSSTYSATINGGYLGTGGAGSGTFFWGNICAKFNGSAWMTGSVIASSDSRIKEDIQDINDNDALNKLLAIEPKTYKYVDKIAKGDKKVYGFIAQQVREVIPEATIIEKSYIPNIMSVGEYNDYIITLPSQPTKLIIKVNDNIKCYDKDNNEILVKVEEVIDELSFKIKAIDDMKPLEYTHDKIFIHGTEVEDFHTLSKEYIFTLNVCATQELHRRIEAQDKRIKEIEEKMADILKYLSL